MEPTDLTIEILKNIRDEVRGTRESVDSLRGEVHELRADTNARFDALRADTNARFDALGRRLVESEIRTSTALTDLAGTVREMTGVLRVQGELRPRVERCEREIEELKRRTAG